MASEYCKCGHHISQHNISPEMQINLFKMRPSGIFAGRDPKDIPGLFKTETCIGYGKYLWTEEDLYGPGSVTKFYDPCSCKGFDPLIMEVEH